MKIKIIAALTLDGRIARTDKELVNWTGKEDKKIFSALTGKSEVVIMGRKTFQTLPGPLPGRINLVITSSGSDVIPALEKGKAFFISMEPVEIIERLKFLGYDSLAVIGGNQIYGLFFRLADEFWITIVPVIFGQGLSFLEETGESEFVIHKVEQLKDGSLFLNLTRKEKSL